MHLLDVRGLLGPKVKKLRFVSEETWFPSSRDVGVDCRFYTLLQESFYTAYRQLDVTISEHRRLHWGALRVAPGGVPILPFFERFTRLPALLSERDKAGPKTHGWIARSTQLVSGSARLDSFYFFNKLSQHFSSLQ